MHTLYQVQRFITVAVEEEVKMELVHHQVRPVQAVMEVAEQVQ